ncbi:MAG: hypothetical protein HQL69_22945 [Magnetococcales bacterium]|nr:hypothetical protein [Magnetococcales bacterium]
MTIQNSSADKNQFDPLAVEEGLGGSGDRATAMLSNIAKFILGQWSTKLFSGSLLIIMSLVSILLLLAKGIYTTSPGDIFIPLHYGWSLLQGLAPHQDIHTALGAFVGVVNGLGHWLAGPSGHALIVANLIVGLFTAACMAWATRTRLPSFMGVVLTLSIFLLCISPRFLDGYYVEIDYIGQYNKHGWALLCTLLTFIYIPARSNSVSTAQLLVDALLAALLITALFFLKVSYILVAGLMIILGPFFIESAQRRLLALALFLAVLFIGLINYKWGIIENYALDVQMGLHSHSHDRVRFDVLFGQLLLLAGKGVLLVTMALLYLSSNIRDSRHFIGIPHPLILAIIVLVGGFGIALGNLSWWNGIAPMSVLLVWEMWRRKEEASINVEQSNLRLLAGAALVLLLFGSVIMDSLALVLHHFKAPPQRAVALSVRQDSPFRDIFVAKHFEDDYQKYFGYMEKRLEELGARGKRILNLDYVNPYPMLMSSPPPKKAMLWWKFQAAFSGEGVESPAAVLCQTDFVIVPEADYEHDRRSSMLATRIFFKERYMPIINKKFQIVEENSEVKVYVPKDGEWSVFCAKHI